jgi:hypothetical protein
MRAIESANARLAADSVRGAEIKAMLKRHAEATAAHVRAAEAVAAAKDAAVKERQTQVRKKEIQNEWENFVFECFSIFSTLGN